MKNNFMHTFYLLKDLAEEALLSKDSLARLIQQASIKVARQRPRLKETGKDLLTLTFLADHDSLACLSWKRWWCLEKSTFTTTSIRLTQLQHLPSPRVFHMLRSCELFAVFLILLSLSIDHTYGQNNPSSARSYLDDIFESGGALDQEPITDRSASFFSAFSLKPWTMKNMLEPTTAPKAISGLMCMEYHTIVVSNTETSAKNHTPFLSM